MTAPLLIAGVVVVPAVLIVCLTWAMTRRAEARYPPIGQFREIDAHRCHYLTRGSGVPVVLLHGSGGSFEDYPPEVVAALAADHRVIGIDRPGHGYSTR